MLREHVVSDGPDHFGHHINLWNPDVIEMYLMQLSSDQDIITRSGRTGRNRGVKQFISDVAVARTSFKYTKIQIPGCVMHVVNR